MFGGSIKEPASTEQAVVTWWVRPERALSMEKACALLSGLPKMLPSRDTTVSAAITARCLAREPCPDAWPVSLVAMFWDLALAARRANVSGCSSWHGGGSADGSGKRTVKGIPRSFRKAWRLGEADARYMGQRAWKRVPLAELNPFPDTIQPEFARAGALPAGVFWLYSRRQ